MPLYLSGSSLLSMSYSSSGASPPTDVTAVQDGPTSIRVSWTPPSALADTTGYRISFSGEGNSDSVNVSGGDTNSYTLTTGLTNGETYTISIVGTSQHFFSDTTTTVEVTLSEREKRFMCSSKILLYFQSQLQDRCW